MNVELEYLRNYLEEEFSRFPEVRIRVAPMAGTRRSIDLPQDYDPEANDLHLKRGVIIYTQRQEHFFPLDWILEKNYERLRQAALALREKLEGNLS